MIFGLIDLTITVVSLAGTGVYRGSKYVYDWYYEVKEEKEPSMKELQKELLHLTEIVEEMGKLKKTKKIKN